VSDRLLVPAKFAAVVRTHHSEGRLTYEILSAKSRPNNLSLRRVVRVRRIESQITASFSLFLMTRPHIWKVSTRKDPVRFAAKGQTCSRERWLVAFSAANQGEMPAEASGQKGRFEQRLRLNFFRVKLLFGPIWKLPKRMS
jgi:hypothetical protein